MAHQSEMQHPDNRQITVEITENARVPIKKVHSELAQEETDIM